MTEVFEVEKVLASKKSRGRTLYKIRWRTFGPEDDTWEPSSHLKGCQDLLDEFHENQASKKTIKESHRRLVNNTVTDASVYTAVNSSGDDNISRDTDSLTIVGGRRGLQDNGSFRRSVLRERYTTAIHKTPTVKTGSQVKRKSAEKTEMNTSDDSNDDAPLSPFLAALCIIFIALAIVFIYFTS